MSAKLPAEAQLTTAFANMVTELRAEIHAMSAAGPNLNDWLSRTVMINDSNGEYAAGVIIDPDTVLTAAHVVTTDSVRKTPKDPTHLHLTCYDGRKLDGQSTWTIRLQGAVDVAIIHAPGIGGQHLEFGEPSVGIDVWTIGNPMSRPFYVSRGVIAEADMHTLGEPQAFGVAILAYAGNSGGPLFNAAGQLVGIVVAGDMAHPASNVSVENFVTYGVRPWRG